MQERFEKIYSAHYKATFQYAYFLSSDRNIAEDLTQEAFLKYYKNLSKFRGECSELTWLCRIVKNMWIDQLRTKKKVESIESAGKEIADEKDFMLQIENRDVAKQIHKILHELPEPYKEVFSLRVFGELPFKDIAELFEKSESWARVTFGRAKMKIVSMLEEVEDE